jgi:hypothetical protein
MTDINPDEHPLLAARLQWELDNPRPVNLRRAEKMIVQGLVAYGFGRQYQVTSFDSFQIAVDDLIITVERDQEMLERVCGGCGHTFYQHVNTPDEMLGRCPRCNP